RQRWHFSRDFTESSCAVTPSTSPSSSPALSSAKGLWIMVFISSGKAKTLGNGMKTSLCWVKGLLKN
ncbi:hypothetical protein HID58_035269, partial [Brassica napus]